MTRIISRRARGNPGGNNVNINGRIINVNLARLVYRCEICYGQLKRLNNGLRCINFSLHRGFIHRDEVAKIKRKQIENIATLPYDIVDGRVIVKGQKDNGD